MLCSEVMIDHRSYIHNLRKLKTVSSSQILMGHSNYSLSLDATFMVSKNWPVIGEHVVSLIAQLVEHYTGIADVIELPSKPEHFFV